MDALRGCTGKLAVNRYGGERALSSCRDIVVYRPGFRFSSSQKLMEFGYLGLKIRHHKPIFLVSSVSSRAQLDIQTAGIEVKETNTLKTVHVEFHLQKECLFGEQFLVVGNDPILGSWDPASAVPLNWSDGHVWTVELDMPAEKEIHYKFILRGIDGEVTWQPDPDRVVTTWETKNLIAVIDDWENAQLLTVIEEKPLNFSEEPTEGLKNLVAGNLAKRREQLVPNISKGSIIGDNHFFKAYKSPAEEHEGLLIANNSSPSEKEFVANFVDNISQTKDQSAVDEAGKEGDSEVAYRVEGYGTIPKTHMTVVHGAVVDTGRTAAADSGSTYIAKDALIDEEGPVLVPGLNKLSTEVMREPIQHEDKQSDGVNASSSGLGEATEPKLPKLDIKQEPDNAIHQEENALLQLDQEELLDNEETIPVNEEEGESEPEAINGVLRNDIEWGHRTLQKFLNNLGLL